MEGVIKCKIELDRIFFPKNSYDVASGEFAIFLAKVVEQIENCDQFTNDRYIKLKGNVCKLEPDVTYKITCKLDESNPTYGNTYAIMFINRDIDMSNKSKQIDFLSGIINPSHVGKLFEKYDDVISLLENNDIKALTSIKGIGHATAMKMIEEYEESKDYSHIYTELSNLNLSSNLIKKLLDYYSSPDIIVDILKTNPYKLIEVSGIGFKKADEMAQKMGIELNDGRRIKACILHILSEQGEMGKSYLHFAELMNGVYNVIGDVEQNVLNTVAQSLIAEGILYLSDDYEDVGLKRYHTLETNIYKHLLRLKDAKRHIDFKIDNWEEIVKLVEKEQGYDYTDEQKEAIKMIIENNVVAIFASAGCGKTALLNAIYKIYRKYDVMGVALSGKAAVRISEATGIAAQTIHRTLGYQFGQFEHNEKFPLLHEIIAIDESTMNNGDLFYALLRAIPSGSKVIMLGDVKQITPIGNCQVFADIIRSNVIPKFELTKLHRQAQLSGIIPTSLQVANQDQIFDSNFEGNIILGELQDMELDIYKQDDNAPDRVIKHFLKHYNDIKNLMEVQIVTALRIKGDLSNYNLNNKIQEIINPIAEDDVYVEVKLSDSNKDEPKIYKIKLGDKVINTKNNYKTLDTYGNTTPIFNGNMGIVTEIDYKSCVVNFIGIGDIILGRKEIKNLELAYACSTHKCQGSGFECVICAFDSSAYMLLNAELIYTAITRAKKYCVLVGQNLAIRLAISKRESKIKQTHLSKMLLK